nr:DUF11 domain-containing protein [Vibrio sonorensis]
MKRFSDNEGELLVTKEAMQTDAQVGDVVEYEVNIYNNNESEFRNVKLVDRFPSGFAYVPGSTELVNSGPDGEFDTGDDVIRKEDPSVTQQLTFNVGDMLAYGGEEKTITEKVRIRYLLRVSVGATFGKYVNSATAKAPPKGESGGVLVDKSNTATATVEVLPDKVFDTASIIGKVFEDHNKDGFQADATAYNVVLTVDLDSSDYVPNTTLLVDKGKEIFIADKGHSSSPNSALANGVRVGKLFGTSSNRTLKGVHKRVYQLETKSDKGFHFTVTTDSGSRIEFAANGEISHFHSGDKADGLSAEELDITRNLYRDGDKYLWEIIIENKGIYEDGIPGVRLMTVEGIVIETDQFGRFHVPDQWVLDKKGKQFLVKLDTDSLPTGMKVFSENPRVQVISPNKLTKFNFSVSVDK